MVDQQAGSSNDGAGCARYGCGCLGTLFGIVIVSIVVGVAFSQTLGFLEVLFVPLFLLIPAVILGVGASKLSLSSDTRRRLGIVGVYLLGFAAICLVSAIGVTLRPGGFYEEGTVPADGGTMGPVSIETPGMRLGVEVHQHIRSGRGSRYQRWSFATVELLDENKEYLTSFGGEFWHYAGYDDGHWEEDEDEFDATLRVPSAGTYYLRVETESNVSTSELSAVSIELSEQVWWGDPAPLQAAGFVGIFLGMILVIIPAELSSRSSQGATLALELEEGARVRFRDREWIVRDRTEYTYDEWRSVEWTLHSTGPGANRPRYLEREYETGSSWEAWLWSVPVDLEALSCADARNADLDVRRYGETHRALPDEIRYEEEAFRLSDSGIARRPDGSVTYHTYQDAAGEGSGRSITIEGEPPEDLSAVVTESVNPFNVEVETEDEEEPS